ncbi:Rne/Rng family ribonuclease [Granulicoccus phenolivorans]|uniref:Rne/Rng family ribonuclease n=1 Tax=Granulicoccus phenolivorans TaxID=266854 RepID=UPI00041363F7|nr:Rne/Rng family ribonuclease [Granulicoccus phenolivorans]
MLDNETPNTPAEGDSPESTQPAPRRRRRAASRPAGPPVDVPEIPVSEQPTVQMPDESVAVATEARTVVRRPRRKPAAAEQPVAAEQAAEEQIPEQQATDEPVAEEQPVEEPVAEEQVAEEQDAEEQVAEEAATEETEGEPQPVAVDLAAGMTAEDDLDAPSVETEPEEQAEPQGRRRRTRRVLTDPFSIVQVPATPKADSDTTEDAGEPDSAETDEDADAESGRTRSRRRTPARRDEDAAESEDTEDDGEDAEDEPADSEDSDNQPRRRRRRRGGRRRRRGGNGAEDSDAEDSAGDESEDSDAEDSDSDEQDADSDSDSSGEGRRRRRRRRRRGEDTSGSDDDPSDTVVRVREPRRTSANDEVTGIDGSTRMEAKRQRRREGRAAGRRRTPILSEAEFLARREAVERTMVIRQNEELSQIAVLEDNILVEHYVDRASATSLIGNVYLGRIQNVLPSMEAAFIDIGRGRNAVLYAGELDWDAFGGSGQPKQIEKVLKSGQQILVQVTKDPVGQKGARLTTHISLPGRYIVYSPGGHLSGISRKLPEPERKRLKGILGELISADASVIVRTAAEGATEEELVRDVNRLKAQWEVIEKKSKSGPVPQQLYSEPDATVRIVRDLFTEDFSKLIIDGNGTQNDAYDTITAYVGHVAPHLSDRIEHWERTDADGHTRDAFAVYRIDEQIAKALERKVFLPSGGSLVIDRTEAMTVIDVNTGKFTGAGGNLEATVTSNNLEAAEEVVRQLRLRDIGGIIVIDFIDMVLPANRELLLRRLVECLGRDRTRHQVSEVTSLGLVQLTRKKIGTGLAEAFTEECECCNGRGFIIHDMPVDSQAPADGGDRGNRRGGRRGRGGKSDGNGKSDSGRGRSHRHDHGDDSEEHNDSKSEEPKPEDSPAESAADAGEQQD